MKGFSSLGRWVGFLLLSSLVFAGGCGKEIRILQYPEFYDPEDPEKNIKTIVVVPFRNQAAGAAAAKAGEALAENMAAVLGASNTYKHVYNRNDLSALLDQVDLQTMAGTDPADLAKVLKKRGKVEAIITGAITSYSSSSTRTSRQVPIWNYNPRTKQIYIAGYRTEVIIRNEGNAAATATLIRVKDGRPIYTSPPVQGRYISRGVSPGADRHGCLRMATNAVVHRLMNHFAVVAKTITVSNDALQTATEYFEGEWDEEDDFRATDDKMYVVLKLPSSCHRNRFRITIAREGFRRHLETVSFRWDRADSAVGKGFMFNPREIARKGGGPGTYVAKFYAGPKPALDVTFEIED